MSHNKTKERYEEGGVEVNVDSNIDRGCKLKAHFKVCLKTREREKKKRERERDIRRGKCHLIPLSKLH